MIFLHGLALAVYEFQRYLICREDQRAEMLKREAGRSAVDAAVEKAEAATAAADAEYGVWKEALITAALEAERVSAYSTENIGTPAAMEVKRLESVALEKAYSYAAREEERAATAVALEKARSAAERNTEKLSEAADLPIDEDAAVAPAAKVDTVPAKQDKPKKKGIFGGLRSGFML